MSRRRAGVTIKHVAADAKVSLQTVSRVINNEPNVRPETRSRVQASIDKLGYVPLIAAQRLSGRRSYLILVLNDRDRTIADWKARQGGDWVNQMLLGGMLKASEHGYRLILELVDTHSDQIERELATTIGALQPDGVILTPPHSENAQICQLLESHGIPFVRIGAAGDGPGFSVTMDDAGSAREATEHLIGLGHRRIGFIAGLPEYSLSAWRVDGWRAAMADAGLPCEDLLVQGDFGYQSGIEATNRLLALHPRPTAIIASNDQMALAALEAARNMKLDVPGSLSLVSFDNTPVVRFIQPPLTAVDQPIAETVAKAVELLIAAARGEPSHGPEVVPGHLVPRESTGPARPTG
ncbi:LacI family transcriptional regulator [Tsuneonella deserti]|uniref:LacI family transcriptional regulator n=1 Tax=Tsuneonella deserti TaxID=2035528 RepID=A0ABQ1RWL8_9SPHN|nr:LacI family DNA-binding transcriptional regulator [Tsuneonella deserti]GGD84848.1 LacI family transcriptional regulator [Tsuneonella deserti]